MSPASFPLLAHSTFTLLDYIKSGLHYRVYYLDSICAHFCMLNYLTYKNEVLFAAVHDNYIKCPY